MKKLLALILTLVMMFTLASCGEENTPASTQATNTTRATSTLAQTTTVKATATTKPTPTPTSTPVPTPSSTPMPTSTPVPIVQDTSIPAESEALIPAESEASVPAESEADDTGVTNNSNFSTKKFGYITISVPNEFSDVEDWDGYYTSEMPSMRTSIDVSSGSAVDKSPEEYSKEDMTEMLGDMLKDYKGVINLNGNKAVYYTLYQKTEGGKGFLRHLVWLFNADISAQYSIALEYSDSDPFFTSDVVNQIINSITLAPEAQHLAAGSKN